MKKALILSSLFAAVSFSAFAQGTINAGNAGITPLQIQDPAINGGVAVSAGSAANNAGFQGAGPGQVTITMYAAANGTSLAVLESPANLIATIQNSASTITSGTFLFGNPYALPTSSVFNGSSPIEIVFYGITTLSNGKQYAGFSALGTGITPATGSGNAATIFGPGPLINSFVLTPVVVPEPTTIVLGGLGAAALLAFRRRK